MVNKFFNKYSKAQSSIETIIILAMALFILTALTAIVYDQITIYNAQQEQKIASLAVNTVAKEVNDAYFSGPGTIKTILVRMPNGIDFNKSSIEGRTLVLNVNGSDIFASTKVDVRGIWPDESGTYSFTISAFDDYVSISIRPVNVVPNQINEYLTQGQSADFNIIITNNSEEDYYYSMIIDFPAPSSSGVALTSTQVGLIESFYSETQTVNFSISCSLNSFGSYSGKIVFVQNNSSDSNITVPVNLFCSSAQTKLQVYPTSKYFYAATDSTYSDSVLVCNTTSNNFDSTSTSVSGLIAPYVVTSFTGGINANSCTSLPFVINAPSLISNYAGTLVVNSGGYTSGVDLNLVLFSAQNTIAIDWSTAHFGADGKSINDINLAVLTGPFTITHAMILFTNDIDDANIIGLYFNNQDTFPTNTKANTFDLVNIDDYILERRKTYDLNIAFDSDIRNDSEKFRIVLKTDANNYYWSPIFDSGYISDYNASHFSNLIKGQEPIYPRDANLIALWRMNDKNSSGWILNSVSGLRDGNLKSGADVSGIGLWDKNALYLDGVGTYVALNSFSLDSNNFTISAWVNPDSGSLSARRTVFQSAVGEQPQLEMGSCSGGINAVCAIKDGIWMAQSVNNVINTGSWYHVVYTKNGSGANHNFYVNGTLVDLVTNNPVNYTSSASSVKNIGARSSIQFFDGLIDEVAIWNAALSAEEIKEIYSIGSGVHDFNTQADGNGLYLASSGGELLSDGNFYSRVFDFNGMVDFNQLFFTRINFVVTPFENKFFKDSNLNNNYFQSSLVSNRIDTNNFIGSGELDWNLLARNDYGSGTAFRKTGVEFSESNPLYDINLISLWHFNDKNLQGWILNSKTNLRDGQLINGANVNTLGLLDTNALFCDGSNDYANIGVLGNTTNGSMTFSAWVFKNENAVRDVIFGNYNGANGINFEISTSNYIRVWWNNGEKDLYGTYALPYNSWVLVTIVRDASADKFYVYVDGELKDVLNGAGTNVVSTAAHYLCKDTRDGTTALNGKIDEVAIWDKALSATEVSQLYISQAGNFSEPNLVGVYHFDNNANDLSGKRNDGVWSGTESYSSGLFGTSAASFNGSSYVLANDATTLNKYTFSAWVYRPTFAVQGVFQFNNTTTGRYVRLFANSATTSTFEFDAQGEVGNLTTGTNGFALNDWVHVAASFDGTNARVYLNGSLKQIGVFDLHCNQANNIYIGSLGNGTKMIGKMDEVIIWDKALTDEQIRNLYTQQKGEWLDSNLVFYHNFDSTLSTSTHDGARGFFGSLNNGALITKGLWDSNSVYLDGINDNVTFGSVKGDLNRKLTISLWVYPTKIDDYKTLFQDSNGTSVSWALQNKFQTTNLYTWYWSMYTQKGLGYAGLTCEVKNNRLLGSWQHVGLTYDADTNTAKVYHNGVYCPGNSGVFGGELTIANSLLRTLTLSSSSSGFRGYVDEIKIYDRVLSESEMLADYNNFLESKFVDLNIIDSNTPSNWDSVKINSTVGYDFGKEIEDWNRLKEKGINEFGQTIDSNYLFSDNNLSGLWHFNNNLTDSSGNPNNGSWSGTGVYSQGIFNTNAVDFSASVGRYVIIPDNSTLDITSQLTISAWVNMSILPSTKALDSVILAKNNEYLFRINTDNKPRLYIYDGSDWEASVGSSVAIPIKTWAHVVATMRTSGSNIIKNIYINGVLTGTESAQSGTITSTSNSLYIGSWAAGSRFDGQIDEVAIWKKELSAQNILDLYNSQKPMFQNGLIGLWHLNNNALDSSPYLRNGAWGGSESYSQGLFDTNSGDFNSSNYIDITNATNLNPTSALTASVWIKPSINLNQMDGWAGIFSKGTFGGVYQWGCMKYATTTVDANRIICMFTFSDNSGSNIVTNTLFFADKWYHVVFVLDAINGVKSIYVNGVLDNNASASKLAIKTTTDPLSIGRVRTTEKFNGKIEEFALYERALSSNEVIDLYRKGVSRLDLNVYSCSDATCSTKVGSQYITDVNNGVWIDLNSDVTHSQYLGFDAFFKSSSSYSDKNAGNFWVGSFIKDINFYFPVINSVDLYARTSVNGYSWDDWNALTTSSSQTLLIRDANFFQYKSVLGSRSPVSPVLRDVNISYTRISN